MSKIALDKIAKEIKDTTAKTIRETYLNRNVHVFAIDKAALVKEITSEIGYRDGAALKKDRNYKPILNDLRAGVIEQAAAAMYTYLTVDSKLKPFLDVKTNTFTVSKGAGTYRLISDELTVANKIAIKIIDDSLKGRKSELLSGKLIQFDHNDAVANVRTAYALSKSGEGLAILNKLLETRRIVQADFDVYASVLTYYKANEKTIELNVSIQGKLESGGVNEARGNTIELSRRGSIIRALTKLALSKDFANLSSSDSYVEFANKSIHNAIVKAGGSGKLLKLEIASNKAETKSKVTVTSPTVPLPKITRKRVVTSAVQGSIPKLDLRALINAKLFPTMVKNMTAPGLVNRTGTLAASARVEGQLITPQGFTSLTYNYSRNPYNVFDSRLGKEPWNTPARDPGTLVERSIREIAREFTTERIYLRRVR